MHWQPPLGRSRDDFLEIADMQWFRNKVMNTKLADAPVISQAFSPNHGAKLCFAEDILPLPVSLAPHLQHDDCWQVLFSTDPMAF